MHSKSCLGEYSGHFLRKFKTHFREGYHWKMMERGAWWLGAWVRSIGREERVGSYHKRIREALLHQGATPSKGIENENQLHYSRVGLDRSFTDHHNKKTPIRPYWSSSNLSASIPRCNLQPHDLHRLHPPPVHSQCINPSIPASREVQPHRWEKERVQSHHWTSVGGTTV